jgi:hypothetical protein
MTEGQLIEVRLGDLVIAFDGRVIEFFGEGNASRRIHVATIEEIGASDGRFTGAMLQIKVRGESDTYYSLNGDDAQRAALEALLAQVEATRSTGGGP